VQGRYFDKNKENFGPINTGCCTNVGILTLLSFTAVLASKYLHQVSQYLYCIFKPLQCGAKMLHSDSKYLNFGVQIPAFWNHDTCTAAIKFLHFGIKIPAFWHQNTSILSSKYLHFVARILVFLL
jgi:hypothetical protein